MSILTLAFLINILLYLVIFTKPRNTKVIRILVVSLALTVILSSQYYPNTTYYAGEQLGHAREAYYWMSTGCKMEYSVFEPFKTLAMHIACITGKAWLFDFTCKLAFSLLLVGISFIDKFTSFESGFKDFEIRNSLLLCSTPLAVGMFYGAPRNTLASLVCLIAFAIYKSNYKYSLVISIASSFFHSVGFLVFPVTLSKKVLARIGKQKKSTKLELIFIFLIVQLALLLSIRFIASDYLSGESDYIGNKSAVNYKAYGAGVTALAFGVPRSIIILLLIFAFSLIFLRKKPFLSKYESFSLFYSLICLVLLGLQISPSVAARFINLFYPSILFLILFQFKASRKVYYKLLFFTLPILALLNSYFDDYQISSARRHDLFNLPYIYSVLLHIK